MMRCTWPYSRIPLATDVLQLDKRHHGQQCVDHTCFCCVRMSACRKAVTSCSSGLRRGSFPNCASDMPIDIGGADAAGGLQRHTLHNQHQRKAKLTHKHQTSTIAC